MNPFLKQAADTAVFLAETLPENYEILVLDLTRKAFPAAAGSRCRISHADELRRYVKKLLENKTVVANGRLTRRGDALSGSRLFSTSIQFIKDEAGVPAAALVLAMELSGILAAHGMLSDLVRLDTMEIGDIGPLPEKTETDEPTLKLIELMTSEFTDEPERMSPEERMELLMDLYDTGVFSLRGAVSRAAVCMGMSEQSVYRYLSRIRRARGE